MDRAALQAYLLRLFERHDVALDEDEDGWLLTDGDFPAIGAVWHEGTAGEPGRLDVDVVLDEDRRIEESFAGGGNGEAACREALKAFERGVLPLLLAGCWYVTDDRSMRVAAWQIGVHTWDVFIGPFTARGVPADVTDTDALDAIEAALKREVLTPGLHWLRLVHSQDADGSARSEALLDNEPWAAGTQALTATAWPQADAAYSVRAFRAFLMLDVRDY